MAFETDKELLTALDHAAAEIEALDPEGADRLRYYLQCAELGIDPLLGRVSPVVFAQEVVDRLGRAADAADGETDGSGNDSGGNDNGGNCGGNGSGRSLH
ncbi:hypothetical protein [Rhodospirillum centenum]|uniref:Uncharacterized protein n=1 Tax=Rhodospirillum centenum (strain ATCC 51521 / SW) TaxID=414684 RepID=B6IPN9_RHOCS|nr:hypothetical protein [Rhodospirillum centenum]ACI99741.1 hypothetical protein RC1_2355 [Rhodospirillum centenum SW]